MLFQNNNQKGHMKNWIALLITIFISSKSFTRENITVSSPDKKIVVIVNTTDSLSFSINYQENSILQPSGIDMTFANGKSISNNLAIKQKSIKTYNEEIISLFLPFLRKES